MWVVLSFYSPKWRMKPCHALCCLPIIKASLLAKIIDFQIFACENHNFILFCVDVYNQRIHSQLENLAKGGLNKVALFHLPQHRKCRLGAACSITYVRLPGCHCACCGVTLAHFWLPSTAVVMMFGRLTLFVSLASELTRITFTFRRAVL